MTTNVTVAVPEKVDTFVVFALAVFSLISGKASIKTIPYQKDTPADFYIKVGEQHDPAAGKFDLPNTSTALQIWEHYSLRYIERAYLLDTALAQRVENTVRTTFLLPLLENFSSISFLSYIRGVLKTGDAEAVNVAMNACIQFLAMHIQKAVKLHTDSM